MGFRMTLKRRWEPGPIDELFNQLTGLIGILLLANSADLRSQVLYLPVLATGAFLITVAIGLCTDGLMLFLVSCKLLGWRESVRLLNSPICQTSVRHDISTRSISE